MVAQKIIYRLEPLSPLMKNEKFMRTKIQRKYILLALILNSIVICSYAQPYEIKRFTINNGGKSMKSDNNQYEMNSSIGQVDASKPQTDDSSQYKLTGGFWHKNNNLPLPDLIFKNSFEQ